jgi:DNA-binding transcriptional ArsR family regulator
MTRMAEDIDATLAALADPTRRRVVDALRDRPRRAGELAALVGVSAPALSRHLRVLRGSGVVTADFVADDARGREYALRIEPFVALEAWLDQVHAFWGDQLDGFADHVNRAVADGRVAGSSARSRTTRGKSR